MGIIFPYSSDLCAHKPLIWREPWVPTRIIFQKSYRVIVCKAARLLCNQCRAKFSLSLSLVRVTNMTTVLSGHGKHKQIQKQTKCKLQWIQKLTKVNIPLFKRDPTCVTSSKLKPWWLLKFGLNKFVQIVVPSLVWASTSSAWWERKVVEPVAAGIPFCWISGHPSGLFTRCHKYWNCRLKSETLQGLIWCNDVADCNLSFMRFIVSPQSSSLTTTHPTIDQSILRCTTFSNDDNPKRIVGEIIALRYFSRNFKETCLLIKVSLCLWNFTQTTRKQWANSVSILVGKFPVKIQPKHLCVQASWSTSAK